MKKFSVLLLFAAILTAAASEAAAQANKQREKAKVGALLTLSGSFATAGEDCRRGIEAALAVGGRDSVDILYADSKNEPAAAISELRRLARVEKTSAVYTHRSSIGMPLNPVSLAAELPLLGAVGHKDFAAGNKFAFQLWPRSDDEGYFMAEEFLKQKYQRAAQIYTEDEWTSAVSRAFAERFAAGGGALVFNESVVLTDTDFQTLLAKLKQQTPDAVFMNVLLPQIGPLLKKAREFNISGELYFNFYVSRTDVLQSAGSAAMEGVKYLEIDTNLPALKTVLNIPGDSTVPGLTVASYTAVLLLAQAARQTDNPADPAKLYSALLQQKEIRTPDYVYPVEERYVKFPFAIKEIRGGKGREAGRN